MPVLIIHYSTVNQIDTLDSIIVSVLLNNVYFRTVHHFLIRGKQYLCILQQ